VPEAPVTLSADVDRLQQIFSNLVGNAFKYTPPGGAVAVSLQADDDFAVVMIADEGEGIPAERLPRILDLFQRETTTGSGLGVGLAVVKALAEAHGGDVSAASAGLGRGDHRPPTVPIEVFAMRGRPVQASPRRRHPSASHVDAAADSGRELTGSSERMPHQVRGNSRCSPVLGGAYVEMYFRTWIFRAVLLELMDRTVPKMGRSGHGRSYRPRVQKYPL